MAGRPFLRKVNARIEELGGDDWFFSMVGEGTPLREIAEEVGCSRGYLYVWLDQRPTKEERRARYRAARRRSAEALEEEGREVLDDLAGDRGVSSAEVSLARSRANYRQWQAKVRDREQYGDRPGVEVNLSVGDLHLGALKAHGSMGGGGEIADAEPGVLEPALEAEVLEPVPGTGDEEDLLEAFA